ncbi:hypothetical protein DAPPUDRAFT_310597 [Daphnia pulex]|uniref:Uncharacterized protein n=1 Tax=Daphnia pulex TaxID=6669 RepID=E9FU44_DAPPU|nr:hypothetical protein DAPPUDRAFT_310597 [Daphnia pulex]|eukprot:EFX89483.1 hypothetical protein DAPPUDRAFT_310597 [Daphnia pulex]
MLCFGLAIWHIIWNIIWPNMMTWVKTAVHFVEMSAIVSCTSHLDLVQKHLRARVHGQLEPFICCFCLVSSGFAVPFHLRDALKWSLCRLAVQHHT